jgi:hypothetical protein
LAARVLVARANGEVVDSKPVAAVRSDICLKDKFADCCAYGKQQQAERIFERLGRLDKIADVRQLAL